jgi:uncharacterized protein (TIGR02145 family)
MGELFKLLKTYQKGGSPKLMIDWIYVPRKVRIKIVKEVLPTEYVNKLEHLNLIDEIFNGDDVQNEITYKKRLERYLERYPDFNEFIFESCHWKNVRYDVNFDKEQDTKELYRNDFQYLYYAIFGEIFSVQSYKIWSEKSQNQNKFLSDFVREIKFGKNKYKPKNKIETIIDIDGNVYKTIQIGSQIWMAENLRVSKYRNGDMIPNVTDDEKWENSETGAWCYYDNNPAYNAEYGKLYNWYAVDDKRGLAPEGWHIPTDEEWKKLADYLGGNEVAGGKLKEAGKIHWEKPNENGTNESDFRALPGGYRYYSGTFDSLGSYGKWWSATEGRTRYAWYRSLSCYYRCVLRGDYGKPAGFAVRCVRDY